MPTIRIAGTDIAFSSETGETILGAGLRAGLGLQYECNAGGCGACKVKLVEGKVDTCWTESPALTDADRRRNRVLACQSIAATDCVIGAKDDPVWRPSIRPARREGVIEAVRPLTRDLLEIRVAAVGPAQFLPGQFAILTLPEGPRRAYSMSNLANADGLWSFVIRNVPGGAASTALFGPGASAPGHLVVLDGPFGHAYLRPTRRDLIGIAGGSGLGPILSIARGFAEDPAFARHKLTVLYGARRPHDLAYGELLAPLEALDQRIRCHSSISEPQEADAAWPGPRGHVHALLEEMDPQYLAGCEYYLAGPAPMIDATLRVLSDDHQIPLSRVHFDRFY